MINPKSKTFLGRWLNRDHVLVVDMEVVAAFDEILDFISNEIDHLFPANESIDCVQYIDWKRSGITFDISR